jgi:signal transduction histidine kinase
MKFTQTNKDLLWVLGLVLVFGAIASWGELSEQVSVFSQHYEAVQLDELPLTLLVLSAGLLWFAWRRTMEAQEQVQERIRSEHKVQELLKHNSDLLQRLFTAQEDERLALARDLHDEMGQTSTAIRTEVALLQRSQSLEHPAVESVRRIDVSAQHLSHITRLMLQRLRPPALDSMGLAPALSALCEDWQKSTQTMCRFHVDSLPDSLNDYACVTVYRIVQEALTNIARHAHAQNVSVKLVIDAFGLYLSIEDDGQGMADTQAVHSGFGLLGIQERVASLAGEFKLQSQTGQGVHLTVHIPRTSL